jgi:hypothetical protein
MSMALALPNMPIMKIIIIIALAIYKNNAILSLYVYPYLLPFSQLIASAWTDAT